jgi:hypothetical protein
MLGNGIEVDTVVSLFRQVNRYFNDLREIQCRRFYARWVFDYEERRRLAYYNVRLRRVLNLNGQYVGEVIPVGAGVRGS